MMSASVVMISKYTTAFNPTRSTFFRSPALAMPLTTTQNTIGPITILMSLRKPSPSSRSDCPKCGHTAPTMMPMTSAIITLPNSEFRNLAATVSSVVDESQEPRTTVPTGLTSVVMENIRKPI